MALLPATETPRSAGTSTTPLGERTVMSAMAGPAFGLTSSSTESWVASAPTPVNHWSATGGAQSTAESGRRPRPPCDQAGREVAGAGDHRRAEPLRRRATRGGCGPAAVWPTAEPDLHVARRPSRPDLRRGCSRRAGRTPVPGRAPGQTTDAEVSAASRRVPVPLRLAVGPGCRSSSASTATTGSTTARSTSAPQPAPHRRPPSPVAVGRGCTQHEDDQDRDPLQDQQRRSAATTAARRARSRRAAGSTCQARVRAVLGAGLVEAAGRVERGRDVAVGGRRQHDVLDAARRPARATTSGVGREASACTSAVKSRSSVVRPRISSSPSGDAVAAAHGVGQAVLDACRG